MDCIRNNETIISVVLTITKINLTVLAQQYTQSTSTPILDKQGSYIKYVTDIGYIGLALHSSEIHSIPMKYHYYIHIGFTLEIFALERLNKINVNENIAEIIVLKWKYFAVSFTL